MRIGKFHIQNFKSILDSGEITLDSNMTTLIGKNESGKTNILKALRSFGVDYNYVENDLCLHSETMKKMNSGEIKDGDIRIVTIWFDINSSDRRKLRRIHSLLAKIETLKCTKRYDNLYHIEIPETILTDLGVKTHMQILEAISEIQQRVATLREKLVTHSERHAPFNNSKSLFNEIINDIISFDPRTNPDIGYVFEAFYKRLRSLPSCDPPIRDDIDTFIKGIDIPKNEIIETLLKEKELTGKILDILPNFVYFSDIEKLEDSVEIEEFLNNKEKHQVLSNLVNLCGIEIDHTRNFKPYDMLTELRHASTTITGLVNQSWTQEKVELNLRIVRENIVVSIYDNVIKREHPPSMRSQGFQWFLSFYTNFISGSQGKFKNTIILLDDPGVYLHPSGQKDLLRTLEKITRSNQIIFSTHSPFMIDRNKLERIKIVSRKEGKGTLIEEEYHKSDHDAFQPIRASIGMTIGDSLFATKKNLLVEGYSDELILEAMSAVCSENEKECIDTSKITIFPVYGVGKMSYFATLFTKESLEFLVLLDHDPEGRKTAKELKRKFSINEENILTLDMISNKGNDLEIEDLIDIQFYLEAVNLVYGEAFRKKLGKETISIEDLDDVSFSGIKKLFRRRKIETKKKIDTIKVAKKFTDLIAESKTPDKKTISHFSKLFKIINEKIGIP